jgi:hypothetical protein
MYTDPSVYNSSDSNFARIIGVLKQIINSSQDEYSSLRVVNVNTVFHICKVVEFSNRCSLIPLHSSTQFCHIDAKWFDVLKPRIIAALGEYINQDVDVPLGKYEILIKSYELKYPNTSCFEKGYMISYVYKPNWDAEEQSDYTPTHDLSIKTASNIPDITNHIVTLCEEPESRIFALNEIMKLVGSDIDSSLRHAYYGNNFSNCIHPLTYIEDRYDLKLSLTDDEFEMICRYTETSLEEEFYNIQSCVVGGKFTVTFDQKFYSNQTIKRTLFSYTYQLQDNSEQYDESDSSDTDEYNSDSNLMIKRTVLSHTHESNLPLDNIKSCDDLEPESLVMNAYLTFLAARDAILEPVDTTLQDEILRKFCLEFLDNIESKFAAAVERNDFCFDNVISNGVVLYRESISTQVQDKNLYSLLCDSQQLHSMCSDAADRLNATRKQDDPLNVTVRLTKLNMQRYDNDAFGLVAMFE